MKGRKYVLVDGNGVLYGRMDEDEQWKRLRRVFESLGIRMDIGKARRRWKELRGALGKGKDSIEKSWRLILREQDVRVSVDVFRKMLRKHMEIREEMFPLDGALKFLKEMEEEGVRVVLVTDSSFSSKEKEMQMRRVGLKVYRIFSSCELGMNKSNPEAFRKVLNELRIGPNETVFLGHEKDELDGAEKAGIRTFSLTKGLGHEYVRDLNSFKAIYDGPHLHR